MIIYHHRRIAILLNGDFPKELPMAIRHGRSLAPLTKRGIKYGKLRRAKTLQSLKLIQLHQNMHQCQHVKNKWTKPRNLIPLNYCLVKFLFLGLLQSPIYWLVYIIPELIINQPGFWSARFVDWSVRQKSAQCSDLAALSHVWRQHKTTSSLSLSKMFCQKKTMNIILTILQKITLSKLSMVFTQLTILHSPFK